jgi:hypothetical protein
VKRVASHESLAYLGHLKNVLEQSGIACLLRNEQLSGALGEIPFLECLPELWVLYDDELDAAQTLLDELRPSSAPAAPAWRCRDCGESNEGQFAACWSCGRVDDGEA